MNATKIKIPAALRHLQKYGADALKPSRIIDELPTKRQRWAKPLVSKRVANTLRKKAMRNGTFGSYDALTGIGWDKSWDVDTFTADDTNASNASNTSIQEGQVPSNKHEINTKQVPWMTIRPMKETKRERTREARAKKIEDMVSMADDKILEYRLNEKAKKPTPGVENTIKKLNKLKK